MYVFTLISNIISLFYYQAFIKPFFDYAGCICRLYIGKGSNSSAEHVVLNNLHKVTKLRLSAQPSLMYKNNRAYYGNSADVFKRS
jgi:hypothetical protein